MFSLTGSKLFEKPERTLVILYHLAMQAALRAAGYRQILALGGEGDAPVFEQVAIWSHKHVYLVASGCRPQRSPPLEAYADIPSSKAKLAALDGERATQGLPARRKLNMTWSSRLTGKSLARPPLVWGPDATTSTGSSRHRRDSVIPDPDGPFSPKSTTA